MLLLVDLGGTNCRCVLQSEVGVVERLKVFKNNQHTSLESVISMFLEDSSDIITQAAFSIAAPISKTAFTMTNLDWIIDRKRIEDCIGSSTEVHLVNDFSAVAMSLPFIGANNSLVLNNGLENVGSRLAPKVVLGPGTGLGVGALIPAVNGWSVVAGEGGHVSIASRNEIEYDVVRELSHKFGHVSAERVISGQGLEQIYQALGNITGSPLVELSAADISRLALEGDKLSRQSLDMMYSFLATVASDLALTFGSKGGVYLAGGVLPKLIDDFQKSQFIVKFKDKGRFSDYLHSVPVILITEEYPAFVGLREMLVGEDVFSGV